MPLPATRVFHPKWSEHNQPVTDDTMNALIEITRPAPPPGGDDGWDPVTGPTTSPSSIVTYSGLARVSYRSVLGDGQQQAGDQEITTRTVSVVIPRDAAEQPEGSRVQVVFVDTNGPAGLAGRELYVRSTNFSSHALDQLLVAQDDQSNQEA